jgi:GGDEF domain-containing protein
MNARAHAAAGTRYDRRMLPSWTLAIVLGVAGFAAGWGLRALWPLRRAPADLPLREGATGLPNRAAALDALTRALSLAERRGLSVTVLFIILDNPATERERARAEHTLAQRLVPRLRTHELLAHWAPGAFVVVLPDADLPASLVLASDLRQIAATADDGPPATGAGSISIGVHSRTPPFRHDLRELAAEMVIAVQRVLEVTAGNGPGRIEIEP